MIPADIGSVRRESALGEAVVDRAGHVAYVGPRDRVRLRPDAAAETPREFKAVAFLRHW